MIRRSLETVADEPVSHNPAARKRVLVRNGEVPGITQVARAEIPPGEVAPAHVHADMWEIFVCESGTGAFVVNGVTQAVAAGDCLVMAPGESHEVRNTGTDGLILTVIGVLGEPLGGTWELQAE